MKLLNDAIARAATATILWAVLSWPFIKTGSLASKSMIFNYLIVFIPVLVSMYVYNLVIPRRTAK